MRKNFSVVDKKKKILTKVAVELNLKELKAFHSYWSTSDQLVKSVWILNHIEKKTDFGALLPSMHVQNPVERQFSSCRVYDYSLVIVAAAYQGTSAEIYLKINIAQVFEIHCAAFYILFFSKDEKPILPSST